MSGFRLPDLELPRVVRPVRLARVVAVRHLARGEDAGRRTVSDEDLEGARALLEGARRGPVPPPDRRMLRTLAALYADTQETGTRELIRRVVDLAPTVGLSIRWRMWQATSAGAERAVLAEPLGAALLRRLQTDGRGRRRRLAAWLPAEASALRRALHEPAQALLRWCESAQVPVTRLDAETLDVAPSSPVGVEMLASVIRRGAPTWWALAAEEDVAAWARDRGLAIEASVLERRLVDLGRGAERPGDLPRDDRASRLRRDVYAALKDPSQSPTRWAPLSERARTVYEWLALADEFDRILEVFQRSAERDRAAFWEPYFDALRDARYYDADGTAVCMMVFGNVLIIEFGTTGNATYVYSAPPAGTVLRALRIPKGMGAGAFKDRYSGIKLGSAFVTFRTRWSHTTNWQSSFRASLAALGINPLSRRRASPPQAAPRPSDTKSSDAQGAQPKDIGVPPRHPAYSDALQVHLALRKAAGPMSIDALEQTLGISVSAVLIGLQALNQHNQVMVLQVGPEKRYALKEQP